MFNFMKENEGFSIIDNVLVQYTGNKSAEVIPYGCSVVGYNAFNGATFESIVIPKSVRIIKKGAFIGCRELKTVILETYPIIEHGAFENCPYIRGGSFREGYGAKNLAAYANRKAGKLVVDGNKKYSNVITATGAYAANPPEIADRYIPIDIESAKEVLQMVKSTLKYDNQCITGCVFTCNNDFGTVYCKVRDNKGFYSLVKVLSLYSDGRIEGYYTGLSGGDKETLGCCLRSFMGIAPEITEDPRLLLEISLGSKNLMGIANVCEDTMFGSVPDMYGSIGVLILIKQ